jgi:hypothetical protein
MTNWHNLINDALERRKSFNFEEMAKSACNDYYLKSNASINRANTTTPLFWSTVQTLRPALYFNTPEPRVSRRNPTYTSQAEILSTEILENNLKLQFENQSLSSCIESVLEYYFLSGLGTLWLRVQDEKEGNVFIDQTVIFEPVHYLDFIFSHARRWQDVQFVARACYKTREWITASYGEKQANELNYNIQTYDDLDTILTSEAEQKDSTVKIWEIWDKETKSRIVIVDDAKTILSEEPAPLNLRGFFPCPKPLFATLTDESLYPIPDHHYIKEFIKDIDKLNQIIRICERQIRPKVLINGQYVEKMRILLSDSVDSDIVPIANWLEFAQTGGSKGNVDVYPIDIFVQTLTTLFQIKEQKLKEYNEAIGISDIVRGVSDPVETATAQQLKSNYSNLRLEVKQKQVQELVRDAIELAGEIIAETFDVNIIIRNANLDPIRLQQDVEYGTAVNEALQILRTELKRDFVIDIETDSTLKNNELENRQSSQEYLSVVASTIQNLMPLTQISPAFAPVVKDLVLHVTRQHSNGRRFESDLEKSLDQLVQSLMQPPPPPQGPSIEEQMMQLEQAKLQMNQQLEQAKLQMEMQIKQLDLQFQQQELGLQNQKYQADLQLKQAEFQLKQQEQQLKAYKQQLEEAKVMQKQQLDQANLELKQSELEMQAQKDSVKLSIDEGKMILDNQVKQRANDIKEQNDLLEIQTKINLD